MKVVNLKYVFLICTLLLSGCVSPLVATMPDEKTGNFPTSSKLKSEEIKIFKPINNLKQQKLSLAITSVDTSWDRTKSYKTYMKKMLENIGFVNITENSQLETFIIKNNLNKEIPNLDNRIAYNQLSKYLGNYLIVTSNLEYIWQHRWKFTITVYDPVSSNVKFYASTKAISWSGVEKPILLPVINALKKWFDESKKIQKKTINNNNRNSKDLI